LDNVPLWELVGVLLCIGFSILFSGSETALNTLGTSRLEKLVEHIKENGGRHRFLEFWLSRRNHALSVILIGNNVANIVASALATVAFEGMLGHLGAGYAVSAAIFSVSFLILTFGEIIPKTFAQNNPERYVSLITVLYPIAILFTPITWMFTGLSEWVIRSTGGEVTEAIPTVTEEDIEDRIAEAARQGNLDEDQERLLSSVFDFDDILVKEVMVPRTDIVGIQHDASWDDIVDVIDREGHSRYPVYTEDLDHLVGVLYVRDLLCSLRDKRANELKLDAIVRKPFHVPDNKNINELMRELQTHRIHMAIVVDEFGGTAGLITVEDIVEEVFGEIYDEYDDSDEGEDLVRAIGQDSWVVDGKVPIRDLEDAIEIEFPEDDGYSTVAGFILNEVGLIPKVGREVRWNGLLFTVLVADSKRVIRVRIDRSETPAFEQTGS
jgi:CBS domain containing-hemolysin-like protein